MRVEKIGAGFITPSTNFSNGPHNVSALVYTSIDSSKEFKSNPEDWTAVDTGHWQDTRGEESFDNV